MALSGLAEGVALALCATAIGVLVTPRAIDALRWLGAGKQIREEGPETHRKKAGTPSMGGLVFVTILSALGTVFLAGQDGGTTAILLALALAAAALGAVDDMLSSARYKRGGLRARPKLAWQGALAAATVALLWLGPGLPAQRIPGIGELTAAWAIAPLGLLAIVATGHAVNLTDGLDGLAGGTTLIAFAAFATIAFAQDQPVLGGLCLLTAGAISGFLWYNINPARLFMGDCGSLALGSLLGGVGLAEGQLVALIPIGGVFAAVTLSVIIQVAYFKRTGGKRIFRMAPIHHHFEKVGWPETQIVMRFWLVGALCALVGLAVAL